MVMVILQWVRIYMDCHIHRWLLRNILLHPAIPFQASFLTHPRLLMLLLHPPLLTDNITAIEMITEETEEAQAPERIKREVGQEAEVLMTEGPKMKDLMTDTTNIIVNTMTNMKADTTIDMESPTQNQKLEASCTTSTGQRSTYPNSERTFIKNIQMSQKERHQKLKSTNKRNKSKFTEETSPDQSNLLRKLACQVISSRKL